MKTLKTLLTIVLIGTVLISCRTENDISIDPPVEKTLIADSNTANLMGRTSLNDGSFDNIIDNASCFNIQLPLTATVNLSLIHI